MSKKCSNLSCGREIQDSAVFCPFCGTQQVDDANLSEEERLRKELAEQDGVLTLYQEALRQKEEECVRLEAKGSETIISAPKEEKNAAAADGVVQEAEFKPVEFYEAASSPNVRSTKNERQRFEANGVSFEMVWVEGGTFIQGTTPEQAINTWLCRKHPAHKVTLRGYWMGETVVTGALWKAVMGNGSFLHRGGDLPVVNVSWNTVHDFLVKLNRITGVQFRLPTEAEWEYAARGGENSKGFRYSGSNVLNAVGWYMGNSSKKLLPVKVKAPNELGLFDRSGGVFEWCSDWYGEYHADEQTNPVGPSVGRCRVHRGGSYWSLDKDCRVSSRGRFPPNWINEDIGFRIVL